MSLEAKIMLTEKEKTLGIGCSKSKKNRDRPYFGREMYSIEDTCWSPEGDTRLASSALATSIHVFMVLLKPEDCPFPKRHYERFFKEMYWEDSTRAIKTDNLIEFIHGISNYYKLQVPTHVKIIVYHLAMWELDHDYDFFYDSSEVAEALERLLYVKV